MKCIECKFVNLRKDKTMSEHAFGFCMMTMGTFYSLEKEHECQHYIRADDEKIQKRIDWYERR